jgi:NAD(P)-dependent dehydrogenase (short-subunit alcohol dehydrogenase family)
MPAERTTMYGATKSALEAMSAVWATELNEFGITVNVLVPGGPTDTALITEESGWPREQMLPPEIMEPPARWLFSNDSDHITGQRITASKWEHDTFRKRSCAQIWSGNWMAGIS